MEVFRDLYISATAEEMAALIGEIETRMPVGWSRDKIAEIRAATRDPGRIVYCFACSVQGRSPAMLVIAQRDHGTFYASNIVPHKMGRIGRAEYNAILEDFYQRVFKPSADAAGVSHHFTDAAADLDRWMGLATAEKLRNFSMSADKSSGSLDPYDRKRWNAFVLSAHREDASLDPSDLRRWLAEVEGWAPEIAEELAVEYRRGRDLLAYAEGQVA